MGIRNIFIVRNDFFTRRLHFDSIIVWLPFFVTCTYGQVNQTDFRYYERFDNAIGYENTGLYNGLVYTTRFRAINDTHPFFEVSDFQTGRILYDGQFYNDILLKYDLFNDEVLVPVKIDATGISIQLVKEKVDFFFFDNIEFHNVNLKYDGVSLKGFFQVLLKHKDVFFYKKHFKKPFRRITGQSIYYEFVSKKPTYILVYEKRIFEVKNVSDLKKIFPEQRDGIVANYNKRLHKTNRDDSYRTILNRILEHLHN